MEAVPWRRAAGFYAWRVIGLVRLDKWLSWVLRRPGRSFFTILSLVLFICLLDQILPIIGNTYIPPRRSVPPKLPNGLSLVDTVDADFPIAADIVFVHGLGSFPDTTWRKKTDVSLEDGSPVIEKSWIRELLPDDLPQARLMYFNYDSTTYNDAPQKNIEDIATELLQAFETSQLRRSAREYSRPIIFLCHSYGGLVVKQALIQAKTSGTRFLDLIESLEGILFLGTPHFGTKYASFGRQAALRLDRLNSNPDIFLPLTLNSSFLINKHQAFMKYFEKVEMFNFFETHATQLLRTPILSDIWRIMLVDKMSSTFTATNTTNIPMDTDHSGLNKFNSPHDPGYNKNHASLQHIIQRIIKERRRKKEQEQRLLETVHKANIVPHKLECSLSSKYVVPGQTVKSFVVRSTLRNKLMNELSTAIKFKDPPHSVTLFGEPGSGKSQIALEFCENHRTQFDPILWIDATSLTSILQSYRDAFEALELEFPVYVVDHFRKSSNVAIGLSHADGHHWVIKAVRDWLNDRTEADCPWLVVIDNADSLPLLHDIFPKGRMGSVIVTSRDELAGSLTHSAIHVGMLTPGEAVDLLLRRGQTAAHEHIPESIQLGKTDIEQKALSIVTTLERLPLVIDLAGAYINGNPLLRENLTLFQEYFDEASYALLKGTVLQDYGHYRFTVATMWETSFNALNSSHPQSAMLLLFLAHLHPVSIEDRLFLKASNQSSWFKKFISVMIGALHTAFRIFISITCVLASYLCVWVLTTLVHIEPKLVGRSRTIAIWAIFPGLILIECVFRAFLLAKSKIGIHDGYVIPPLDDMPTSTKIGIGFASVPFAEWLLGNLDFSMKLMTLAYLSSVALAWIWLNLGDSLNHDIEKHIQTIMEYLDFSETSVSQLMIVLQKIHRFPGYDLGWHAYIELAWIIFLAIVSQVLVSFLASIAAMLWTVLVYLFFWLIKMYVRGSKWKRVAECTKLFFAYVGGFFFAVLIGFLFAALTDITGWDPFATHTVEHRISTSLVDGLLNRTESGAWNTRLYSDAAMPSLRYGLLQRTSNKGYTMHKIVQWWAQHRLEPEWNLAWSREASRFLTLAYHSETCWNDVTCQQILVPHLFEVASAEVASNSANIGALRYILRMIYQSLRKIEKYVPKSLESAVLRNASHAAP